jgi:MFS family permease
VATVQTPGEVPAAGAVRAPGLPGDAQRHLRRNLGLTIGEIVCFSIGIACFDSGTVLASFVATLTASTILLGLLSTVFQVSVGLPQLAAARFLAHRPRKLPFVVGASLCRNTPLYILAAATWFRPPAPVLLAVFFVCYALFALGMGMESVAWLDIFAKIAPQERRGQIFAIGRTLGNLCSFGAGFLVARILAAEGQFPRNYALLFLVTALLMTAAMTVFALVREPIERSAPAQGAVPQGVPDDRAVIVQGRRIWRQDGVFRRYVIARIAYVAHLVAVPFYLLFAREAVGIDDATIGVFVSASMVGQLGANLVWGWISARFGNRRVVQGALLIAALLPLYVLLTPALPRGAFLLVYVASGAVLAGEMIGWMNLLLEIAPAPRRPLYISLQGTLLLPANLLPLVGGVALSIIPYRVFFPLIALALATSFVLVSRIGRRMEEAGIIAGA